MSCPHCGAALPPGAQFCTSCGKPVAAAGGPAVMPTVGVAAAAPPPKKSHAGCIIAVLIVLLIGAFLVVALGVGGYFLWKKQQAQEISTGAATTTVGAAVTTVGAPEASAPGTAAAGLTRVAVKWDEPAADVDLEIWNAKGDRLKERAFKLCGEDVKRGPGEEYFVFDRYDSGDYRRGDYTVSVYLNTQNAPAQVPITLELTKPDGSVVTRQQTLEPTALRQQWHAFRVDAATGEIEDMDKFIKVRLLQGAEANQGNANCP